MKVKRWIVFLTLLLGLALALTFIPQGITQDLIEDPTVCERECLRDAREDARACRGDFGCLVDVRDAFEDCLLTKCLPPP